MVNGYTEGGSQYNRNFSVGGSSATFNIAATKTFTLIGDMVGDAAGSFNIKGGGTLAYTQSDVADGSTQNQHINGTAFNISEGSTFDLSSNDASKMDLLLLRGRVSLTNGNLHLMTGDVTMNNNLSISGTSSISGATNLSLTGEITMAAGDMIDFNDVTVDFTNITLNLSGLEEGQTYNLFTTKSDYAGWGTADEALFSVVGFDSESMSWAYDSTTGFHSLTVLSLSETLTWSGGSADLAVGSTNWNDAKTFEDGDSIILQGEGGQLNVAAGGVELGGLSVANDSSFTLEGGEITMSGAGSTPATIVKNGSGTLTLLTDNNITNVTKQINAGILMVGSNDALGTGQVQISANATLSIASGLTVNTGVESTYSRTSTNYTVNVGENSTLTDNVNLLIGGGTTTITGGGTYEIWGFTMSITNNLSNLLVDENTTLVIKGTSMNNNGGQGSFMMGNWAQNNVLTIKGTLDSHAGISVRDAGTTTINVEDGGELILRKGLAAITKDGAKTVNITVKNDATLTLFNKDFTGSSGTLFTAKVYMDSGSTLQAGVAGTTTVAEALTFDSNGGYTFAVADGNTLAYGNALSVGSVTMAGDGALTVNSLTLNSATRNSGELSITSNNGGTVTIQNATAGVNAVLTANSITGASLSNVSITGAGAGTSITNTTLSDVTLSNVTLSNTTLTNATLTNVVVDGSVVLDGDIRLTDSTLNNITVNDLGRNEFTTREGFTDNLLTFDVLGINAASIDGRLTLTLGDLGAEFLAAFNAGEVIVFNLDGVLPADVNTWYGNIFFDIDGIDLQRSLGFVTTSGELQLYIPEPSTATLSLLALAGLLARRRRKSA